MEVFPLSFGHFSLDLILSFVYKIFLGHVVYAQTPVIGGSCKIGTADVQIGGKQTQFFLKCEATSE